MEKYIIFCMGEEEPIAEPIVWFKKLEDAKREFEEWKKKYPSDKPILAKIIKR